MMPRDEKNNWDKNPDFHFDYEDPMHIKIKSMAESITGLMEDYDKFVYVAKQKNKYLNEQYLNPELEKIFRNALFHRFDFVIFCKYLRQVEGNKETVEFLLENMETSDALPYYIKDRFMHVHRSTD